MNRRKVLTMIVAGGTYSLPFPSISTPARTAASQRIVIRHWGGSFAKIFREILYRPFTQATGIEVVGVESRAEPIAEIQMMVKTGRHLWDMAAISDRATLLLTTDKIYLERHELEHDPNILSIPSQFRSPYGVGANIYTTLLAYRTHAFKRGAPTSWRDLWNIDQLPGRRALRKRPFDTIEIALMADGVPPGGVYPCDLERAFRSLDRIKRHSTGSVRSSASSLSRKAAPRRFGSIGLKTPIRHAGVLRSRTKWAISVCTARLSNTSSLMTNIR